jgi:hypothetical protein
VLYLLSGEFVEALRIVSGDISGAAVNWGRRRSPHHGWMKMIGGQKHGTARVFHGDYFIDLEHDTQCWRVIAVTHGLNGSRLLPPAFSYPDRSTAEQYARAAISVQLSVRRRR